MNSAKKVIRHERLFKMLQRNPFLTDEQLAKNLAVSIQTIRLDRLSLQHPGTARAHAPDGRERAGKAESH